MKLAYGRMLQDGLDGRHGLPRSRLAELAERFGTVQAEVRRRRAGGEYGFYGLVDQGETIRQITKFAEGVGQAFDHVLVLGIGGSALGTKALINALRRPAWNEWDDEGREFYPRLTVLENVDPDQRRGRARADRSASRSGERHQQIRRHGGDDGAVPRGSRLAGGGAGRRRIAPSRLHHRSRPRRPARAVRARRHRDARRAAGGRRPVQRALPGGTAPRGAGGDRHRRAARRARGQRCRGPNRTISSGTPRRCMPVSTGRRTAISARGSTCSCPIRTGSGSSPTGIASSGPRAWASAWTARGGPCTWAPRRWRRWAPPTSTARCSFSWRVRTTRSSPSSGWSGSERIARSRCRRRGPMARRWSSPPTSPTSPATPWASCSMPSSRRRRRRWPRWGG